MHRVPEPELYDQQEQEKRHPAHGVEEILLSLPEGDSSQGDQVARCAAGERADLW